MSQFETHLVIGDPHVQISNIEECRRILNFAADKALEHEVDKIVILGDLFHTHSVIRLEVLDFWKESVKDLLKIANVTILSGNHDINNPKSEGAVISAINSLSEDKESLFKLKTVTGQSYDNGIGYSAYQPHNKFIERIKSFAQLLMGKKIKILYAHQTFTGAQYDNGFYAEDGIDPALVDVETIISGHIHTSSQVGKVFYPGTPKWDTMSDANQNKGLWILTLDTDLGVISNKEFISTASVAVPILSFHVKEGDDLPKIDPKDRNYVILEGKSSWITKIKSKLIGANIKVIPTDKMEKRAAIRVSSGNIGDYLHNQFEQVSGVSKEEISEYLKNL